MNYLHDLPGAHSSKVELVEIDGKYFVLKTAEVEEVVNEHRFQQELKNASLPFLWTSREGVSENQLLIEYVQDSPSMRTPLGNEDVRNWGETLRHMHAIVSSQASSINEQNETIPVEWSNFLHTELQEARNRKVNKDSDISPEVFEVLKREIDVIKVPSTFSLLHADMHSNNILLRDSALIPFDKGSAIFFGDALYDLPLVILELPLALVDDQSSDHLLWQTFLTAYGDVNEKDLMRYCLLRFAGRYPNTFTPQLKELIELLTDELSK